MKFLSLRSRHLYLNRLNCALKLMVYSNHFEGLELKGATELNRDELGRGAYGKVYTVKYCQTICAAKQIHSILVEGVGQVEMQRTIESFM